MGIQAHSALVASNFCILILTGFTLNIHTKINYYILSLFIICTIVGLLTQDSYIFILLTILIFLQYMNIIWQLKNWLIASFIFITQVSSIMISWFITYELPRIFFPEHNYEHVSFWEICLILVIQNLIIYAIVLLLQYSNMKLSYFAMMYHKKNVRLLSSVLTLFFLSIVVLHGFNVFYSNWAMSNYTLLLLLLFNISLAAIIHYSTQVNRKSDELRLIIKNYITTQQNIIETQQFKHDFKAIMLTLDYCLKERAYSEAETIIKETMDKSQDLFLPNMYQKISLVNNVPIQGVLLHFLTICQQAGIEVEYSLSWLTSNLMVDIIDVTRCLSILLNNAYEEVQKEGNKKQVSLTILDDGKGSIDFQIRNKMLQQVSIEKIVSKGWTSKEGHKGLGLTNIRKIEASNKSIHVRLSQVEGDFLAVLSLDYSLKE